MFFERPDSGERAVLVHLNLASETEREDPREFEELVLSAGGDPVAFVMGAREVPDSRTFVGSGKLQEIAESVREYDAQIVMFNHSLSPSQERNLEKELQCRVLDRTGLILDIFAQRARTHEGKLQVELAQLQHMSTRLVRGWTHLERQKVSACAARAKPSWKPTAGCCGRGSSRSSRDSKKCVSSATTAGVPGVAPRCPWCHWWAIPMRVNPPCSTA